MKFKSFFDALPEEKRETFEKLHELITKNAPNLEPYLMGKYLAYGKYHYKYKSGREGDWFTVALKSNKNTIAVYIVTQVGDKYLPEIHESELQAKVGRSCINFKKAEDIDFALLKKMIKKASKLYEPLQVQ